MTITIKGRKYNVIFFPTSEIDPKNERRFITTCTMIDDSHRAFAGIAIKAPEDRFCAVTGKKVALQRAFQQVYRATPSLQNMEFSLAYEQVRVNVLGAEPE